MKKYHVKGYIDIRIPVDCKVKSDNPEAVRARAVRPILNMHRQSQVLRHDLFVNEINLINPFKVIDNTRDKE